MVNQHFQLFLRKINSKILYFFIFSKSILIGQQAHINCNSLKKILTNYNLKLAFRFENNILLYDKMNIINDKCQKFNLNTIVYEFLDTDTLIINDINKINDISLFVFYSRKINKRKYLLSFWQPYSGGCLTLSIKIRRNSLKVRRKSMGVF